MYTSEQGETNEKAIKLVVFKRRNVSLIFQIKTCLDIPIYDRIQKACCIHMK